MSIYGPRSIGTAEDFGLDPDGGRWVVTCTAHSTVVNVPTRREAREIHTDDFCERCMEENHTCPRCGGGIPDDRLRGQYPGAISRTDNRTEICSRCGTSEGTEVWLLGSVSPKSDWPVEYGPEPDRWAWVTPATSEGA